MKGTLVGGKLTFHDFDSLQRTAARTMSGEKPGNVVVGAVASAQSAPAR